MQQELKPCPFCGSKGYIKQDEDHHGKFYTLGCSNESCMANTILYTMPEDELKLEEAINQWNTRVN